MLTHRQTCLSRFRALAFFVVAGTIAVSVNCGSYSPRGGATSAVQLRMGDAPADRVLTFEVSAGAIHALTFNAQGNVTGVAITANSFTVSAAAVAEVEQGDDDDEHGQLENITGMVTAVSGSTFTMTPGQNAVPLTFTTDENTEFKDGASLGTILNTIVDVEGITQSNGGLYAKEVESVENEAGMEAKGIITQVVGNPATQLSFVAQDGSGAGMGDA